MTDEPDPRASNCSPSRMVWEIPVVIDGELVMRESNAIIRYLASKHGAEALYPTALAARFKVEQWMDWVAYDLTHAMRGAFLGGQLQEEPWNNAWFVAQGRRDFTDCVALVEEELGRTGGPHILGGFTLADIPLGLVVNRWFSVKGFDKPAFPAVAAYYEKLSERPGYRAHGRNGMP